MNQAQAMLAALSQRSRLAVFRLLVKAGPQGRSAGTIAEALDLPLPTLSFHLRTLSQAGLVRAERQGRSILYRAEFTAMNALLHFLAEDCCGGRPEICSLREPADARAT